MTVSTLPKILAVLGVDDAGPSPEGASANCPHCGAEGRYIVRFLCDDGSRRGAMRGCFKLFPNSNTRTAKLIEEAFKRKSATVSTRAKLASWWQEILDEVAGFEAANTSAAADLNLLATRIDAIDGRRQEWLKRNFYGTRR